MYNTNYMSLNVDKIADIRAQVAGKNHPFNSHSAQKELLDYVHSRLALAKMNISSRLTTWRGIDFRLIDILLRDKDETFDSEGRSKVEIRKFTFPLMASILDDMLSFYTAMSYPREGFVSGFGKQVDNENLRELIRLMNQHAVSGVYLKEITKTIMSILKYNIGYLMLDWETEQKTIGPNVTSQVSYNKIKSLDVYNTFVDPSCNVFELNKKGEFFGFAERISPFLLRRDYQRGIYANLQGDLQYGTSIYYENHPRKLHFGREVKTDWERYVTGDVSEQYNSYEFVTVYIRMDGREFNLYKPTRKSESQNPDRIWKLCFIGNQRLIYAEEVNNNHGDLPIYAGAVNIDEIQSNTNAPAELIAPLQDASTVCLNIHVEGLRKHIFGTTYYDPNRINFSSVADNSILRRVPVSTNPTNTSVNTAVYVDTTNLDTRQTLSDMRQFVDIAEKLFPAQALPANLSGIDRAVDSQIAGIIQGTTRISQKNAAIIDQTLFAPLRSAMVSNIAQYWQRSLSAPNGIDAINLDTSAISLGDYEFVIGSGLRIIERQFARDQFQTLLFAALQSPVISQQYDISLLFNYWAGLASLDVDFNDFRIQEQQNALVS